MLAGSEAELLEPREESSLPTTARLSHAIDRLDHLADHAMPVGVKTLIAWRGVAVDHLTVLEGSL